jgi:hypothetical protein
VFCNARYIFGHRLIPNLIFLCYSDVTNVVMSNSPPSSWSSERLTPRQFVERYSLPRLARLAAGAGGDIPAQPLVLYCQYRSGKVQARCLAPRPAKSGGSPGTAHWQSVGPGVVIPDTYSGEYNDFFWVKWAVFLPFKCIVLLGGIDGIFVCKLVR